MLHLKKIKLLFSALSMTLVLAACGGSDNTGTLTLSITDAPVDGASEVVVEFTGIELKPSSGPSIDFDFEPTQIDLLALQGGDASALLDGVVVEAGDYNWVRLKVNAVQSTMDSYISFEDGSSYSLYVPSGNQTGLKLNRGFVVAQGNNSAFTIDFDLRKSVVNPVGQENDYKLKPTLRMLDNSEVGTIQGSVANAIAEDVACEAGVVVYVYEGSDIIADDEGSATAPLVTANVEHNITANTYDFTVAYLNPMDYTLAITCSAADDLVETDENIVFDSSLNATVVSSETRVVVFEL